MRRLLLLLGLLPLFALSVDAQPDRERPYSTPSVPSAEVLDRLNLKLAWSVRVPTEGLRDGFVSLTLAPIRDGDKTRFHLIAQTRNGLVTELDAETGQTFWRTRVGNPNTTFSPVAFNNRDIVAIRGQDVFGLSRSNGDIRWRFQPGGAAITAPLMDNARIYLNLGSTKVAAFGLPTQAEGKPFPELTNNSVLPLDLTPAQTESYLLYPSSRGSVLVLSKTNLGEFIRYRTEGGLESGVGVHEVDGGVYIGSRDTNAYGFTLLLGEQAWRLATGGPVIRAPFVNDEDVFVTAERVGLLRVHRRTMSGAKMLALLERRGLATIAQLEEIAKDLGGAARDASAVLSRAIQKDYITQRQKDSLRFRGGEIIWTAPDGDRMLAVNPKFVYAMDRVGRLLVIDRERGRLLSRYDLRDFPIPVYNELTDRVYLAANNGLIVCVHDREYLNPVRMKALLEPGAPAPVPGGGQPPAPAPAPGG